MNGSTSTADSTELVRKASGICGNGISTMRIFFRSPPPSCAQRRNSTSTEEPMPGIATDLPSRLCGPA